MLRRSLLSRKERRIYSLSAAECKTGFPRDTGTGDALVVCAVKCGDWIEGIAHISSQGHSFHCSPILRYNSGKSSIQLSTLRRYSWHCDLHDKNTGLCHAVRTGDMHEMLTILRDIQSSNGLPRYEAFRAAITLNRVREFSLLKRFYTPPSHSYYAEITCALKHGRTKCLRLDIRVGTESSSPATRRRLNDLFHDLIIENSVRGVRALLRVYDSQAFDFESGASWAARATKAFEIMKLIFEKAFACNRKFDLLSALLIAESTADSRVLALIRDWSPEFRMF